MSESRASGRPGVLDPAKRQTILALLANGSSRRAAARYVGCAPSTITRTALRDPAFAAELHRAEQNPEIEVLRAVRVAARQPRYWRAAAWLLERRNPDDFARRGPDTMTWEQIGELLTQVVTLLDDTTSEENHRRALALLNEVILGARAEEVPRLSDEFPDSAALAPSANAPTYGDADDGDVAQPGAAGPEEHA